MKVYITNSIQPGYDGLMFGNIVPGVALTHEKALSVARTRIEDIGTYNNIYDNVDNTIHTYDDENETWTTETLSSREFEDSLDEANEDSLYITDIECDE